jgi:hypothetical protein
MKAVNLIPTEQRAGSAMGVGRSEGAAYAVMVVLGGLALLAFLYGRADHQISSRRAEAATLTARAQSAQAEASQLAPFTTFVALREQRENAVSSLVDSRFDWAHVFHEFGRVLPSQVSVASLSGTIGASATGGAAGAAAPPAASATPAASGTPAAAGTGSPASAAASGPAVTSATPPGSVPLFTLAGCATSQPAVALLLDRLRLIDGVSSVTLQSSSKGGGGAAGGGGCSPHEPAYTVQIAFDPIPAASAISTITSAKASTTSSGGAR